MIALSFVAAPIVFVFYQFTLSGYAYLNYHRWQWLFTLENTLFIVFSLVISYALFQARIWGWVLAMIYHTTVPISSLWFLYPAESILEYTWIIGLLQATSVLMLLVLLIKEIRVPFLHPKTQWWKQDKRHLVSLDVVVKNNNRTISAKTSDLSKHGIYVVSDVEVEMKEQFEIQLKGPDNKSAVEGEGKVVWINSGDSKLSKGFGINFLAMELSGNRIVRRFVKNPEKDTSRK